MTPRTLGAVLTLAVGLVMAATPASAEPADAAAYGQHVRHCTQAMGFDQSHHPGLHRGITGWDAGHAC